MKTVNFKKTISFVAVITIICAAFTGFVMRINGSSLNVTADGGDKIITLTIGNPMMTVDGTATEIDPGNGTVPIIIDERTLLPVRAIVETAGGTVDWNGETRDVTLSYKTDVIRLTINSTTAYLNGAAQTLDVTPVIINERTMLPIRFIAESFGFDVQWDGAEQKVTITIHQDATTDPSKPETTAPQTSETSNGLPVLQGLEYNKEGSDAPTVYFTSDISSDALMKIYDQLEFNAEGNVAVKLSTGEAGNTHYLDPNLIKNLVQSVDGTIVECNTAYGGSRSNTAMHRQVAEDHGFTAIADVDIMDADGTMDLAVSDKAENITRDIVGKNYANYDSMLVLSHFKGHAMGGFGGAIKNISIGIGSSSGKMNIHSGGHSTTSWSGGTQDQFLEAMAEAAQAVHNDKQNDGGIVYISVMNHLSVDCDCDGNPAKPEMNDVGILASYDPVALDQACVDIVYNTPESESGALQRRIERQNGIHTLEHAAKIGLGSREYNLVSID